jgi:hypothetical protein
MASGRGATSGDSWGGRDGVGVEAGRRNLGDDAIGKDAAQRAWSGNDGDARDHRSGGNEQLYAPVRRYVVHLHLERMDVPPSSRIAVNCATPAIGRPSPFAGPWRLWR